jgi:hypothetical protein
LEFVPPHLGQFYWTIQDKQTAQSAKSCFANASSTAAAPVIHTREAFEFITGQWYLNKRLWKFYADLWVQEPLVAFMDDDSCFTRTVHHEDVSECGKVVMRGTNTETSLQGRDALTRGLWGRNATAQFMTDFPVVVWTSMLPDLRAFVIEKIIGSDAVSKFANANDAFTQAMLELQKRYGFFDEFSLLYHFGLYDAKWQSRYIPKIVPYAVDGDGTRSGNIAAPVAAFSIHSSGSVNCPSRKDLLPLAYAVYPRNVGTGFFPNQGKGRKRYVRGCFCQDPMLDTCQYSRCNDTKADRQALSQYYEQDIHGILESRRARNEAMLGSGVPLALADVAHDVTHQWSTCLAYGR